MQTFTIHQIVLTNQQIDEVNTSKDYPEFYKKYMATTWKPNQEAISNARDMYSKVAKIVAETLEDVFTISNIGKEEFITRLGQMHSISVGDVITTDEDAFLVQPHGFARITF